MTGVPFEPANAAQSAPADVPAGRALVNRTRAIVVHASLVLFALAIVAKAVQVQLVDATRWADAAESQQVRARDVTPPRGTILDATGSVLVETRTLMKVTLTPKNVKPFRRGRKKSDPVVNSRQVLRQALRALNEPDAIVRKAMDSTRRWVELSRLYLPRDVERIAGLPGVTLTPVLNRVAPESPGLQGLVGAVRGEDTPSGGLEQELDSILRGTSGTDARLSDGRGNLLESPQLEGRAARPGHTVTLTINRSLQDLAERALSAGIARTGAAGGDVVMLDPRDGAVLAIAGVRQGKASVTATAIAEAYEPGSVMKPFVVSRAIELGKVRLNETINTEGGTWQQAKRTITDEHKAASMSVHDVIRLSSNIGAAKIALRLTPPEEYEALRDFGFGTPTGVPYPAESRGQVMPPGKWKAATAAQMAIGYEMMATPLQLAAAYASIANDGELLEPVLVREVRTADGQPIFSHQRRVIRRVMQAATARELRLMLASVVDSGTAQAADMSTFDVAGKSGTAQRAENGRYVPRGYNSSFAAMFPAQQPQYVVVVRLIDSKQGHFGGTVAGTVVKEILQGALATREASLDRRALAAVAKPLPQPTAKPIDPRVAAIAQRDTARFDSLRAPAPPAATLPAAPSRVIITLPLKTANAGRSRALSGDTGLEGRGELRPVPSVFGLDARQAARALHAAGFHVAVATGSAPRTRPAAGTLARSGSVVVLEMPR